MISSSSLAGRVQICFQYFQYDVVGCFLTFESTSGVRYNCTMMQPTLKSLPTSNGHVQGGDDDKHRFFSHSYPLVCTRPFLHKSTTAVQHPVCRLHRKWRPSTHRAEGRGRRERWYISWERIICRWVAGKNCIVNLRAALLLQSIDGAIRKSTVVLHTAARSLIFGRSCDVNS